VSEIYDRIGRSYSHAPREDARLFSAVRLALGRVRSVVNVGAGVGAYEPGDLAIVAVEPATTMIAQRRHAIWMPVSVPVFRYWRRSRATVINLPGFALILSLDTGSSATDICSSCHISISATAWLPLNGREKLRRVNKSGVTTTH